MKSEKIALVVLLISMMAAIVACEPAPQIQSEPATEPGPTPSEVLQSAGTSTQTSEPTDTPQPVPTRPPSPSLTLDLLGHAGGGLSAAALDGERAYLAVGPRLVVLDLSAAQGPQELYRSGPLPVPASGLALANERLYWLSDSGRLLVFDLAAPGGLELLSDLAIPPGGQAIAAQGDRLYIAEGYSPSGDSENALRIYDASDPLNIVELGALALPNQALDLALEGERAYVTLWAGALASVDVSDPANPALLHTLGDTQGVYIRPPTLFAAREESLAVYDLSDPGQILPLASIPMRDEPRLASIFAGAVYEHTLYLFDSASFPCGGDLSPSCPVSFHMLDISDPGDPRSLSGPAENPEFDHVEWAQVQGERLYLRDYHGLSALSLSDPAHPELLWRYPAASTVMEAYDLIVREGFVYLGTGLRRHSLYAFDFRDPSEPRLAGPFEPPIAVGGALSGDHLYLSLGLEGLSVLDVSQPDAPQEVARLDGSELPLSGDLRRPLAVMGGTLYAGLDPGGLGVVDLSDPAHPQVVGALELDGRVRDLAAGPERLYALAGSALAVLDASAPHAPRVIASLELPGASQLALSGDLAFVSSRTCLNPDGTGGLAVIGLADPEHPALLGTPAEAPCGILDLAVLDGAAFLAAGAQGLLALDVSDPAAPRLAQRFETPSLAARVAASGGRIYVLDEQAGIYLLGWR